MRRRRYSKSWSWLAINGRSRLTTDARQQEVSPAGTSMRYEVSFKPLNGGLEKTFRLQAQQYHALTVGDQGTLSYKGTRFVGFVSRTPDNE